jgi:hypothetical protein
MSAPMRVRAASAARFGVVVWATSVRAPNVAALSATSANSCPPIPRLRTERANHIPTSKLSGATRCRRTIPEATASGSTQISLRPTTSGTRAAACCARAVVHVTGAHCNRPPTNATRRTLGGTLAPAGFTPWFHMGSLNRCVFTPTSVATCPPCLATTSAASRQSVWLLVGLGHRVAGCPPSWGVEPRRHSTFMKEV